MVHSDLLFGINACYNRHETLTRKPTYNVVCATYIYIFICDGTLHYKTFAVNSAKILDKVIEPDESPTFGLSYVRLQ